LTFFDDQGYPLKHLDDIRVDDTDIIELK